MSGSFFAGPPEGSWPPWWIFYIMKLRITIRNTELADIFVANQLRASQANHHASGSDIDANHRGKDRGVGYAQPGHAPDLEVGPHHALRVRSGTHAASASGVIPSGYRIAQESNNGLVALAGPARRDFRRNPRSNRPRGE